jgi:hypothetical protein
MLLYQQTAAPTVVWPEPMELIWQMQCAGWAAVNRWKRRDIGVSDRGFIAAVVNLPQGQRPWGAITWLADVYQTSRQTLYAIGTQVRETLLFPRQCLESQADQPLQLPPSYLSEGPTVAVTDKRLKRTILTALLPGGVALRPMQDLLGVAFDQSRAIGFLSEFINEAGRRAGDVLAQTDFSPLSEVILARDETYFDDCAFLLSVEPRSYVIVSGHVETGCDSETWGVSLALDQERGLRIIGLAEDGARCYPASLREAAALLEAEFSVPVQKDVWHIEDKACKTVTYLEHSAFRKMEKAEKLSRQLCKAWDDAIFDKWVAAEEAVEAAIALSDQVRFWYGCLCDALELVDWRSGEIRDREINQWLLDETIQGLRQLDHPRVQRLVTTLENQRDELLTFLDWLEVQLHPWQQELACLFPNARERVFFQTTVARAWRLNRALVNGHQQFRSLAEEAQALLAELLVDNPDATQLAEALLNILEGTIRTSCAAETVNSILKPYLRVKRSFQSRETAQNFLNLFILWFNMHPFKRGKRAGQSPFQWADIKVYTPDGRETDDWLEALGYPASA